MEEYCCKNTQKTLTHVASCERNDEICERVAQESYIVDGIRLTNSSNKDKVGRSCLHSSWLSRSPDDVEQYTV